MIQTLAPTARFALLLAGLIAAPLAGATSFNTSDLEAHGRWHSVTLSLGDERHFRALEQHSYSDTLLSLNFTPGVCDLPWLELRVELDEHQAESRVANLVPADLRVDHDTIHGGMAEFITQRGDSGFYVNFYLNEQALLIEEMRQGETLRLRLTRAEEDYWFLTFDLDGADAAIDRAERQCEAAS
ncbi:hypothetical protein HOP52_03490 [Halomonas campisalis]|uniref:Uncharacterized protein n=1 Tax=Billgrantia campisalis TaxID=74661 RepID=A0ABS9P4X6_9GAMM|nr:hypothetical protein [Halomonas campisalis]MCG6656841.1 hypothetical protein [Halomonas campisalis]MDR5862030.1 hypothetical protein [Halomonas campisalis]